MKTMSRARSLKLKVECGEMLRNCGFGKKPNFSSEKVQIAVFAFWQAVRVTSNMHLPASIEIFLFAGRYSETVTLEN